MTSDYDAIFSMGSDALMLTHGRAATYNYALTGASAACTARVASAIDTVVADSQGRRIEKKCFVFLKISEISAPDERDTITLDGQVWEIQVVLSIVAGEAKLLCVRYETTERTGRQVRR